MHYFINPLKKYAVFNGRASRKEYWMFLLLHFIVYFTLAIFSSPLSFLLSLNTIDISLIYIIAMLIPTYSAAARRLHDTNRSAWWLLASFVPFINIIIFVFLVMDGNTGDNKYGHNPDLARIA